MLDDEAILQAATSYLRGQGQSGRLTAGLQVSDPPAVYYSLEPPIPHWTYDGVLQFAVLRRDGQVVPLTQADLAPPMLELIHRLRPVDDAAVQQTLREHWAEIVSAALRKRIKLV